MEKHEYHGKVNESSGIQITEPLARTPTGQIALEGAKSQYPQNWDYIAHWVRGRDRNQCTNCGRRDLPLHVDHIRPLSEGGSNDPSNLRTLCEDCHTRRHANMWDDPYWQVRREARAYGPFWTGYFATIKANILRDIVARTGLRLDESQLSTDIKQGIRESEEFYHQCYTKLDEARKLREEKKTGKVTVIVLTIIGLVLLIPGVVGGIAFSGLASLGWSTVAVIGVVVLVFAFLGHITLVSEKEKRAIEKERELSYWQTLVQVKIEGISKEIKDQALRSPKLSA